VPRVWRLIQTQFEATAFDGEGARLYGGRWNSPDVRIAYASGTIALATLEVLVHVQAPEDLSSFSLASADVPDELVTVFPIADLPPGWQDFEVGAASTALGNACKRRGASVALAVPSAIVVAERNYLLNPDHPDFRRVTIHPPEPFEFDPRLLK
jgi:RES domain-containing protein